MLKYFFCICMLCDLEIRFVLVFFSGNWFFDMCKLYVVFCVKFKMVLLMVFVIRFVVR